MTSSKKKTQFNNIPSNLPKRSWAGCSSTTPCFNNKCRHCWRFSRKAALQGRLVDVAAVMELDSFLTISITKFKGDAPSSFETLENLCPAIAKKIGKLSKYLLVKSVTWSWDRGGHFTPHLHLITNHRITKKCLARILKKKIPQHLGCSFKAVPIEKHLGGIQGVVGYLIDQNIIPTLKIAPKGIRLVTASRGIRLGREKKEDNSLMWLLLQGGSQ